MLNPQTYYHDCLDAFEMVIPFVLDSTGVNLLQFEAAQRNGLINSIINGNTSDPSQEGANTSITGKRPTQHITRFLTQTQYENII